MKHKFLIQAISAAAAVIVFTGCGVTPMYNPPIPDNVSPEELKAECQKQNARLLGRWRCENEAEAEITESPEKENAGLLRIEALTRDGDNGLKPLPCSGAVVCFGGEPYLIFFASPEFDNPQLYAMIRPNFYAAKLDFQPDGSVIFGLVSWMDGNRQPTAPELIFEENNGKPGNMVMNSSAELAKLLTEKKYTVAKEHNMRFVRVEE
ncbi:MAG: hypothetical protein PHI85_07330 [Victivallaceae bacterium]|nr:hypothetical protein [Victivallaceae bacterium]